MRRQMIDFHGIISLDRTLANQLQTYLDEKEAQLSHILANAIQFQGNFALPVLPFSFGTRFKLSEGIEAFSRKVKQASNSSKPMVPPDDWKKVADQINRALWDYLELLEGGVVELYQQLDQFGFEKWRPELINVVESIKDILSHSLEDLSWAVKRLETLLWEYRWACERTGPQAILLSKVVYCWKALIDRTLSANIRKSQKFLNFRYQNFVHRFDQFFEVDSQIGKSMTKFLGYTVLNERDLDDQNKYKNLYQFLKIWELNLKSKALPQREPIRVVRNLIPSEKAFILFKNYYQALKDRLFEYSRAIKREADETPDPLRKLELQGSASVNRLELHTLAATVNKYRDFLLRTDPNPYVRSRWGFGEWNVGPEPAIAKQLSSLGYDIEALDELLVKFSESLRKAPVRPSTATYFLQQDIQKILHDMGQPLTSSSMMRIRSEKLLSLLQQLDELGSADTHIIDEITLILNKAMRADWKYNILHEISQFHDIYAIHLGILGPIVDRSHLNRYAKFKRLLQQIQQWVKDKSTLRHIHEIEVDMSDIKGYLQDFLASVQRLTKDPTVFNKDNAEKELSEVSQQLVEYRYLFGQFFHFLRQNESEEKIIRNQFLFVDQYFESVENKLGELRGMTWSLEERDEAPEEEAPEEKDEL